MDRSAWLVGALFVLLVASAAMQGTGGPPTDPADPIQRALGYLEGQPMTPEIAEAFAAEGHRLNNPTLEVPMPDAEKPSSGLRALHALAIHGIRHHNDSQRGTVDLVQDLEERREIVLASPAASTLGFWALAAHALGVPADDVVQALVDLQQPDGSFPCQFGYRSLDCTGFAVAALAAHGALERIDLESLRINVMEHRGADGAYSDGRIGSNTHSTAWAVTIMNALGTPDPGAEAWILSAQQEDGSIHRTPRGNDPNPTWATAEAAVALSGGHPIRSLVPLFT